MTNVVTDIDQLQARTEELKAQGYVAVRPAEFCRPANGGGNVFSWGDYARSMLTPSESATTPDGARREMSSVFASSGGENMAVAQSCGTPGLGFMEWGLGNRLPNLVYILTKLLPPTAAGMDFIKNMLVCHGPAPKYQYTHYSADTVTEKYIPFASAGALIRGRMADLRRRERADGQPYPEEMEALKADLREWQRTDKEVREFQEANDLMKTYLDMAGDMAMMSQCFCELRLNQSQIGEDGHPVPISQWEPKVTGIRHRSVFTTRLERMDSQYRINYAYVSTQWLDQSQTLNPDDMRIAAIPYLPADTAVADLDRHIRTARQNRVSRRKRPTRFIMSARDFGGPYYADAMWHSIFAGSIFEYAFTIVDDRLTRKRNSNIIGRVIYLHQDYLKSLYTQQEKKEKTMKQLQAEVFAEINAWLSNPGNAGQALISASFTGLDGKEHRAWEIVEIESKANSQAQAEKTELQEIYSIIFFAMRLDSKLIGNTPGDATSSGGTDLRERFLVKQIQFAPMQQLMLRPLEVISRRNKWDPHLVWQIDREVLTTLDNSKTGVTKQEEMG